MIVDIFFAFFAFCCTLIAFYCTFITFQLPPNPLPLNITILLCKYPSLWKENKASSTAEHNAKSVEVGTRKAGHWSDLSGGQSSTQVGKFWKIKCDIMRRLV